jgi:undecaprenyl-diphosphatase
MKRSLITLHVALLAVVAFLWLAQSTTTPPVVTWNEELLRHTAALRTPALNSFMLLVTRLGNPWTIVAIFVLLGSVLLYLHRWSDTLGIALTGIGTWVLTESLKHSYQRPRPEVVPTPLHTDSFSFPSAHALGALVGYGLLLFIGMRFLREHWQRALLLLVIPPMIVLIGASRVYWGVHTLTDVLAGFLVGLAWLLVCINVIWLVALEK